MTIEITFTAIQTTSPIPPKPPDIIASNAINGDPRANTVSFLQGSSSFKDKLLNDTTLHNITVQFEAFPNKPTDQVEQ